VIAISHPRRILLRSRITVRCTVPSPLPQFPQAKCCSVKTPHHISWNVNACRQTAMLLLNALHKQTTVTWLSWYYILHTRPTLRVLMHTSPRIRSMFFYPPTPTDFPCPHALALAPRCPSTYLYTVFRKKHPLTFSFISSCVMCTFRQKLQWIYLRNSRSDNVKIRYSLRPMTSLWRHICKRIIQRLIINNNQIFNKCQQEYYLVTDVLKCHNLCSKYPLFFLTQMWICMSRPQHSVAVTLSLISDDRT